LPEIDDSVNGWCLCQRSMILSVVDDSVRGWRFCQRFTILSEIDASVRDWELCSRVTRRVPLVHPQFLMGFVHVLFNILFSV